MVALFREQSQTPNQWHEPLNAAFDPETWTPYPAVTDLQTAYTFDGELRPFTIAQPMEEQQHGPSERMGGQSAESAMSDISCKAY